MSNPKPYFPTVIKTSISSITKQPWNISPSSKRGKNQGRITFKLYISKPHLLSFLHSMYNSIKLSNHRSLNFKKRRENTDKLSHTPTKNTSTSSKTRIFSSSPINVNFNPAWWRELPFNRKRWRTLPVRILIPKNLIMLKSNISFFIETLDGFPIRQVKSLILYLY